MQAPELLTHLPVGEIETNDGLCHKINGAPKAARNQVSRRAGQGVWQFPRPSLNEGVDEEEYIAGIQVTS